MEIREISGITPGLLEQIGRLRVQAWKTETDKASELVSWIDRFDDTARHWVVVIDDNLVAAARLTIHQRLIEVPDAESYAGVFLDPPAPPIASFNRLVVHPSARGAGLSKKLDRIRLDAAEQAGCRSAILSTVTGPGRVRQLNLLGFEFAGYGPLFENPPLCYFSAPAVLLCRLPRPLEIRPFAGKEINPHYPI